MPTPDHQSPASTPRLQFRLPAPTDAAFVLRLMTDPDWIRFIGDRGLKNVDDARRTIEDRLLAHFREHGHGLWVVSERTRPDHALGLCGLLRRAELEAMDLGYAFLPEGRGRGLAREAATATVDHAFGPLDQETVLAICQPDHRASIRVLESLGFTFDRPTHSPEGEALSCFVLHRNRDGSSRSLPVAGSPSA